MPTPAGAVPDDFQAWKTKIERRLIDLAKAVTSMSAIVLISPSGDPFVLTVSDAGALSAAPAPQVLDDDTDDETDDSALIEDDGDPG